MGSEWMYAGAATLAVALRDGKISSRELLESTLARIDQFDEQVNAVIARNDDAARDAASAADAALARGEFLPLLGVPMTVKESFDVAGLATTCGISEFAGSVAHTDAPPVRALRRAGAIIIGKSNVPVSNGDIQTHNPVFGVTNNPWDLTRTPGGSSGGSAAALAAGYVPLELGSDIGGSVRIPAHYCGVYAHKPTYGIIPNYGSGVPPGRRAERDLACVGPMSRTAQDLELALDILVNSDDLQGKAWRLQLPAARHENLKDFRVLVLDTHPLLQPSESAQAVVDNIRPVLAAAGCKVSTSSSLLPDLMASHKVYQNLLIGTTLASRSQAQLAETRAAIAGLSNEDDSFQAVRIRAGLLSHGDWLIANEARMALRHQWEKLFESFDVVVTPVSVSTAFSHDHSMPRDARIVVADGQRIPYLDLFVWVGVATVAGLPATSVPAGLHAGLPIGAQIIGPYLEDRTALAFARLLEQELGGFQRPPGY